MKKEKVIIWGVVVSSIIIVIIFGLAILVLFVRSINTSPFGFRIKFAEN